LAYPDAIALSPAETQPKTDLEEVVRYGLINFLDVGAAPAASAARGLSEASTRQI
jgi:hypothetical protein